MGNYDYTKAERARRLRARRKAAGLVHLTAQVTPEVRELCMRIINSPPERVAEVRKLFT